MEKVFATGLVSLGQQGAKALDDIRIRQFSPPDYSPTHTAELR